MNSTLENRSHRRSFLRTAGALSMVTLTAGSRQAYAVGEATVLET